MRIISYKLNNEDEELGGQTTMINQLKEEEKE